MKFISDNLPIFSLILCNHSTKDKNKYVIFVKTHNLSAFKDELGKINWAEMPGLIYPSCAYEIFVKKYISIYDKCFPLRKVKAKRFNLRKTWFTKSLDKSVKKIFYISVSLIALTLPMKTHISHIKTSLPILFELLSVYITNNTLKN